MHESAQDIAFCFIIIIINTKMAKTTILEVYKDKKGLFRFRLIAKNGEPVALSSEGYAKKAGALTAVKKLSEWVSGAEIKDMEALKDAEQKAKAQAKNSPKKTVEKKPAPKAKKAKKTNSTPKKSTKPAKEVPEAQPDTTLDEE